MASVPTSSYATSSSYQNTSLDFSNDYGWLRPLLLGPGAFNAFMFLISTFLLSCFCMVALSIYTYLLFVKLSDLLF